MCLNSSLPCYYTFYRIEVVPTFNQENLFDTKFILISIDLSESQAGFRFDRSCVDNIFILNEVIQGRLQEGKKTFCFFLDIKKAYDTVWRDGLWYKMWEMGIQGKL